MYSHYYIITFLQIILYIYYVTRNFLCIFKWNLQFKTRIQVHRGFSLALRALPIFACFHLSSCAGKPPILPQLPCTQIEEKRRNGKYYPVES